MKPVRKSLALVEAVASVAAAAAEAVVASVVAADVAAEAAVVAADVAAAEAADATKRRSDLGVKVLREEVQGYC